MLASITRPRAQRVSPDGSQIAFFWDNNDASNLYVMSAAGGWPRQLTFNRDPVAYWSDEAPQWSPDGQWIAYTQTGHVWIIAASGSKPHKVSAFAEGAGSPRWMPDSNHLLLNISVQERARIILTDRTGSTFRTLTTGPGHDHSASIAPDGKQIAYVHQPLDDFNRSDILLLHIETGTQTALTGTPSFQDSRPSWSPDGKWIAFLSERPGFHELFLIDPLNGQEQQITTLQQDVVELIWSPDSQTLLCTVNQDGAFNLITVEINSKQIWTLRSAAGVHASPQWLANGNAITFEFEDYETPPDLYRMELDSATLTQLTFSKPPALASVQQVRPQHIRYPSFDGLEIPAFLYQPQHPNGAAVVYPHGGPTSQYVLEWDSYVQYFVTRGYTFLAPNFRGSTGYGITFERANHGVWGVDDTKDCLAAADYLATLPWIDPQRIGIFGASYGSYMSVCALTYDEQKRFALGVAKFGDCNILSSWAQGDQIGREDLERMMHHPTQNRAAYRAGSPIWRAAEIEKPLFIAHGLLDDRVHPLQSEELVDALKRHDKVFEYITYANEGHGFLHRASKIDFYTRLERFFDWYLL
jgi:dipeptidyl aminopeptidase/acylaminoacyl peptidase